MSLAIALSKTTPFAMSLTLRQRFVTGSLLKSQNITGEISSEFGNLTQLIQLDLSRNYLNGTIPTVFTRIPLVNLSLLGNRMSGPIPAELGEIATLQELF